MLSFYCKAETVSPPGIIHPNSQHTTLVLLWLS